MSLQVALLYGGESSEREISIKTGTSIAAALKRLGHQVHLFDAKPGFEVELKKLPIDVAFIALHGSPGEDGIIQGMLEFMGVPYTGSGTLGSAVAMNKLMAKRLFLSADLKTPIFHSVCKEKILEGNIDEVFHHIHKYIGVPAVIKPILEGSSVGLRIPHNSEQLKADLMLAYADGKPFIVEEFIEGKELTVSILGNPGTALPIIHITPKSGVYDFTSKYTKGKTDFEVPAQLSAELTGLIQHMALQAFNILGCSDFGRVDFILSKKEIPYILEVNTIPGMTETSLLPQAAAAIGLGFDEVCEIILTQAMAKNK
jgi:D-alanine-D-alanine ligase